MIELKDTTAYNVKETAELLHVSDATVRLYIKRGKIRAQKVGVKYYVTDETIADFLRGDTPNDI